MDKEFGQRVFEPINVDTVTEAVVNQLESLVIAGVLKSGQKLPAEREMAEMMQVSRPKLRDALKILEDRGLITSRHGGGTYIAELTVAALSPAMTALFERHKSAFSDYLEFREEMESFAGFLAAQRATEEDREVLRRLIEEMKAAHQEVDPSREAQIDLALHTAIVDATHNSMLIHMMASIYEMMSRGVFYNRDFLYSVPEGRDTLLDQHIALAQAIIDGDADKAAAAAGDHLDFVRRSFRRGEETDRHVSIARKRLAIAEDRVLQPKRRRISTHRPA